MKKLFTLLLCVMISVALNGQTLLFSENFETTSLPDSVTYVGTGTWGKSSMLASEGLRSDSMAIVNPGDSVVMTTMSFSTTGNSFVMLYFDHICKIEFFDEGYVEVSNNNGATWTRLTANEYQGGGQFATQGNKFTAAAYNDWIAGTYAVPANSWWKSEVFDISLLVGNAANVMIRFVLNDFNPGPSMGDNYAWFIDNIRVVGAFSELNPPILTMIPPIVQDTVYSTGPYLVKAHITDQSLVDTAFVVYWVNVGTPDTIGMLRLPSDTFTAYIPFHGFGKNIHYYVVAIDGSAAHNVATSPTYTFYCKFSTGGTFTVGTGTSMNGNTTWPAPYGNWYWGSKHQMIILASELTALGAPGGAIGSLAFDVATVNGVPLQNFTIKMGHTTQSAATTTFIPNLTQVYTAATYTEVQGWNTHTFQTPFVWNGVDNLVIETCLNNSSYTYNAVTYYSTTPFTSTNYYYTDNATVCANTSASVTSNNRPNMKIEILGVSSLPLDVGAVMVYPTGGVVANTPFDVKVKVANYGTDTVTSATINWRLNGVLQTPFSWTGVLLEDSLSTDITLGSVTLPMGVHDIIAWTDDPNGQPDLNTGNDSASISFMACAALLSGTYTIGGTNPDFVDFSAALIALEQCGIDSSVVFNVAPGTYTEQITIPYISGTSSTNTITFQSATGDSTSVVLQYNSNIAGNNYTVKLDGTSRIIFNKMTIKALNTTNGRAVVIGGGSSNNTITNCELIGVVNALKSTEAVRAVVYSVGDVDNNNTISWNRILDGEHGVYLQGTTLVKETGNLVKGNVVEGQIISGITVLHQTAPEIAHNYVNAVSVVESFRGIHASYCGGAIKVHANNVVIRNTPASTGIELSNCVSDVQNKGLLANNMVSVHMITGTGQTMYPCGILINNSTRQDVYYNSVNIYGTSAIANASFRFYNNASSTGIALLNNNFVNHVTGGTVLSFEGVTVAAFTSDYNNLYPEDGIVANFTMNYSTLSAWRTFSSKDMNSFTIKPYFNSNTDLHTYNGMLNGLATPVPEVTVDIDGEPRDPVNPDPGADEFDPPAIDVALLEIVEPEGGCRMTATEPVTLLLKNTGLNTISSGLSASFRFNGSTTVVTESVSGTILPGDSLWYTFTATVNMDVYALGVADTFELEAWTTLLGDAVPYNDSLKVEIPSLYTPLPPSVNDTTILYNNSVTLTALSPDSVMWYLTDTCTVELHQGAIYTTPILYSTTTYWVGASTGAVGSSSGPYTPGPNIAPLAVASASTCNTGPCSTLNDLDFGVCGTQSMWISTSSPPTLTPHVDWIDFEWQTPVTIDGMTIHHAQTTTRFLAGGDLYYWDAGVWVYFHTFSNLPMQCENTVPFPLVTTTRLRITSFQTSGSQLSNPNFREIEVHEGAALGCESFRVPVTVTVGPPPPIDAGIEAVESPALYAIANMPYPVDVRIKNYGLDTLYSATISWSLNTLLQGTYSWTGALAHGETQLVTIDTISVSGGTFCIDAWTSLPNGVADPITSNDTATSCFVACLAGTFTIGPATTGTWDYNTFNAALNDLTAIGICGHVVFEVQPGTYTEQLTIASITGMNANNTVTFRGATLDSTSAILQYAAISSTDNWTVRLNGATHFNFEHLTVKATGVSNGRVFEFMAGANHNRVSNCVIETSTSSTSSTFCPVYSTSNAGSNNVTIENCRLKGGYYGVYWYGTSSLRKNKFIFTNNIVEDYWYYGIYTYYADSVYINSNQFTNRVGAGVLYPVYVGYTNGYGEVCKNYITSTGTSSHYGIYIAYKQTTSINPLLVANNMLTQSGNLTGTVYGMYILSSNYVNVYYNTIRIAGGSATSGRALFQSAGTNVNFVNNIFSNHNGGYAAYFATPTGVNVCDHNNYYTTGINLAYWNSNQANLGALQLASGKDANSHVINPPFVSAMNLHLATTELSAKGTPIPEVPDDIDGDPRTPMPTIGADEIPLIPKDAGVVTILTPPTVTNEGQQYPVEVVLMNYGTDSIYTMDVQYQINNDTPVVVTYTGALGSLDTAHFSMPPMISPAGNSVICAKTLLPNDTNYFNDEYCKAFFGIPLYDAMVTKAMGPEDGCDLGIDTISIWVKNLGVNGVNHPSPSTVTVSYQLKPTSPVVTETFTPVLQQTNDSALYVFNTLADFSVTTTTDTFIVKTWIDLAGDNVKYNDTAVVSVISMHTPAAPLVSDTTIPYGSFVTLQAISPDPTFWFDSLTSTSPIATGPNFTTPILFDTATYWVEASTMTQVSGDFTAPGGFSGTTNCGGGFMIDVTALIDDVTLEALDINCYNAGTQTVNFFYRVGTWVGNAANSAAWIPWGTYTVNSVGPGQATNMQINPLTIPQGQTYAIYWQVHTQYGSISTNTTYTNGEISVMTGMGHCSNWDGCCSPRDWNGRLYYTIGGIGCTSPRVPVTVNVMGIPPYDLGVDEIDVNEGCAIYTEPVTIKVYNQGSDTLYGGANASYRINNNAAFVTETITDTIAPNASIYFTFNTLADLTAPMTGDTMFIITAWVDHILDPNQQNDTLVRDSIMSLKTPVSPVVQSPVSIPYATQAVLTATSPSNDTLLWFAQPSGGTHLHMGSTYTTGVLYHDTVVYVEAVASLPLQTFFVGTGTQQNTNTTYPSPYGNWYWGNREQYLMLASEMSALGMVAGEITEVAFDVVTPNGVPLQAFTIKMAHTTQTTMTTTFVTAGLATVYSVPAYTDVAGWNVHTFQTPFTWNGTSNVILEVCFNNSNYTYNGVVRQTSTTFPSVTRYNSDIATVCTQATGSTATQRPNMRLVAGADGCGSTRVPVQVLVSNPQACDVGVSTILEPVTAVNLGSQENVRVRIMNYGTSPQSNIPVSFQVGTQPPVTETVTATIAPNTYLDYLFVAKANLSMIGNTYQLKAWTSLACDNTVQNDTAWKSVTNLFPSYCISTATSTGYEEIINVTLHTMNNSSVANNNGYTDFTATVQPPLLSPGMTYPISITSGWPPGYSYQYSCWVKVWIDFNRDGVLDPVNELVFSSATTSSNTVTGTVTIPPTAMSGNTLMRVVLVETSAATGVNPCGTYTWGETEDYMVTITPQAACDAGITAVLQPTGTIPAGTSLPVRAVIMNFGSDPIAANTLSVAYEFNSGTPVVYQYPYNLPSMGVDTVVLPNIIANMGNNTICVYIILPCDSVAFNDEVCRTVFGQFATSIPYFDDFETNNYWYKPDGYTNWQYGTPSASVINAAYSGNKAWATNLSGNYSDNANEYLYTPLFDFSPLGVTDTVTLSFYHWCDMASGDYGRVQYSLDGGTNWNNLGVMGDVLGTNWYNIFSGGSSYFSLPNTGWAYSAYKLVPNTFNVHNEVQFRFNFFSNASVNANGWAIDNFKLSLPMMPNDVGVSSIDFPLSDTAMGSIVNVKVTISNFGLNPQVMFPVALKLNGSTIATEVWSGNLPSLGTTSYTFVLPCTIPVNPFQLCAETQLVGDQIPSNNSNCKNFNPLPAYHDVGVIRIVSPLPDSAGNICFFHSIAQPWYQYDMFVRLKNFGQNTQTSIPLKYTFYNGGPLHNSTWTGSLAYGDSVDFQLPDLFMPLNGSQQVCVETDLLGDAISANNKSCKSYTGVACIGVEDLDAEGFALYQNIPNPAKQTTIIGYRVPQGGDVTFGVVSMIGQVLHSELQTVTAGQHQVELDVSSLAAGVYYYFVEFDGRRLTKKLVVNK